MPLRDAGVATQFSRAGELGCWVRSGTSHSETTTTRSGRVLVGLRWCSPWLWAMGYRA